MSRLLCAITLLLIALIGSGTGVAWAHPLLLRASPPPDTILRSSPTLVQLSFSESLDALGSTVTVVDQHHRLVDVGRAFLVQGDSRAIEIRLRRLPAGVYLVRWTVVSADDGHVVTGSYVFGVRVHGLTALGTGASSGGGQGWPDADTLTALLAHLLLLLGAVTWFGSTVLSASLFPDPARADRRWRRTEALRLRALIRLAVGMLLGANVVALLIEAHQVAGEDWKAALSASTIAALLADQHGVLWIVQQIIAVLALGATSTIPVRQRVPRWLGPAVVEGGSWHIARWVQIPLGVTYLYAVAASGHAASASIGALLDSHLVSLSVLVDGLHLAAVGLWLGGQIYIALVLIPALRPSATDVQGSLLFLDALDRFSPVAYASVAVFVVTGPFNAEIHIPSWSAFLDTTYGHALTLKLALIALMMLVSAFTVYVLRPLLRQSLNPSAASRASLQALMERLLGWLRLNPIPGVGVLLATSIMFFYPVPAGYSQRASSSPTWRPAGLQGITVHFLALGHRHPGLLFAGSEQGVYRLGGNGAWRRVLSAQAVWSIALLDDDRTLLAGDEAGDVDVSPNLGRTWRHTRVTSQGVYAVSARPGIREWLLAGAGEGLYVSRDGGTHWERRLALPQSGGAAFAWNPGSSRVVFAGVVAGGPNGSTSVYISRDAGLTWHVFGCGLDSGGGIMSLATTASGTLFAGTMGHAAWTAGMTGGRWHRAAGGMPASNDHVAGITEVPGRPDTLFAGTLGQGVFRTDDGGRRWENISAGLPGERSATIVLSVAYSPRRHTLYAGTADGVYSLSPVR